MLKRIALSLQLLKWSLFSASLRRPEAIAVLVGPD